MYMNMSYTKRTIVGFCIVILIVLASFFFLTVRNVGTVGSPEAASFTQDDLAATESYLRSAIGEYAPDEPVLGGTWYVTDVQLAGDRAFVSYEDGHIARQALVGIEIMNGSPRVVQALSAYIDNREAITVHSGDRYVIALNANPTTGYGWRVADESTITPDGEGFIPIDGSSSMLGSGGIDYFVFIAGKAGQESAIFLYSRPWESVVPLDKKTFTLLVQ